jgi:hypothetical protein
MYKLINNGLTQELQCIKKLSDNTFIPIDPDNTD